MSGPSSAAVIFASALTSSRVRWHDQVGRHDDGWATSLADRISGRQTIYGRCTAGAVAMVDDEIMSAARDIALFAFASILSLPVLSGARRRRHRLVSHEWSRCRPVARGAALKLCERHDGRPARSPDRERSAPAAGAIVARRAQAARSRCAPSTGADTGRAAAPSRPWASLISTRSMPRPWLQRMSFSTRRRDAAQRYRVDLDPRPHSGRVEPRITPVDRPALVANFTDRRVEHTLSVHA